MKVVLLALLTATLLSGVAGVTVRIRAYNATGELDTRRDPFTLGTRVLLICDVKGLPEDSEAVNYRWYHNCPELPNSRCEIQDRDPYYRVVKDTLLVDVTSLDQGGRYHCNADLLPVRKPGITRELAVADNTAPFLYTPTSLLLEHSVLTDVQQAIGRNGQQWITCRSGGQGTRPEIWMASEEVVPSSSNNNSVTIGIDNRLVNGVYHCLTAQSQREYFLLFLKNSATPPTPTVSGRDTSMWTLTLPDGSRVERYIVEFECRVRNIAFIEKYMSVGASGGTGRVATNVSCFGGLGQLYRVKVWAVSGPNISRALVCTPDRQCREEEGDNRSPTAPSTTTDSTGPSAIPTTVTTTPDNTGTDHGNKQPAGTFIGVGVGIGISLLLVLLIVVVLIVVVVAVKRKAAAKQTSNTTMERSNPWFNNGVVVKQEMEIKQQGASADYEHADVYQNVDNDKSEEEDDDTKNTLTPGVKESSTPTSASNVPVVYDAVDKSKKQQTNEVDNGSTVTYIDQYVMSMKEMGKMTVSEEGVTVSGGGEKEEQ